MHRSFLLNFGIFCAVLCIVGYVCFELGFRINLTPSLPRGIYRIIGEAPQRGDTVAFCLESTKWNALAKERNYLFSGGCPSGLIPLLKKLVAVEGDVLTILDDEISVDTGRKICTYEVGRAWAMDSEGRPMPKGELKDGTVPKGQGVVLTKHKGSFDSRYFGYVPVSAMTTVHPVMTID